MEVHPARHTSLTLGPLAIIDIDIGEEGAGVGRGRGSGSSGSGGRQPGEGSSEGEWEWEPDVGEWERSGEQPEPASRAVSQTNGNPVLSVNIAWQVRLPAAVQCPVTSHQRCLRHNIWNPSSTADCITCSAA